MSAKRPAPYSIDEKTLQATENNQDNNQKSNGTQEQAQIDRTIFKVKTAEAAPPKKVQKSGEEEKKEEGKGLLFSNLFQNNGVGLFNNTGLFGSKTSANPETKININSPNLFNGNGFQAQPSLFAKNTIPKDAGSLFSNAGKSIFDFRAGSKLPPVKAGEEDDEGDSAELEINQDMKIDKSKSTGHYEYKEEAKLLFSGHSRKYKKNDGDLIENVDVVVQFKEETKVAFLVVRLSATKHNILSAILLKDKSTIRILNKKQENLQLTAFIVQEGKSAERVKVKLQFQTSATGKQFFDVVNSLITAETIDNNDIREEVAKDNVEKVQQKKQ